MATLDAGFPRPSDPGDEGGESGCVECVGVSPTQSLALTGSLSGTLAIWDLPTQQMRLNCQHVVSVCTRSIYRMLVRPNRHKKVVHFPERWLLPTEIAHQSTSKIK